jgi:hypothetical protein
MPQAWTDEFRDRDGADRIVVKRNREQISESDLPDLTPPKLRRALNAHQTCTREARRRHERLRRP